MTLHQAPPPDSAPLLSDYVDKFQLARELGRGSRTVDRLVLRAGLPFVQVGTRRLFRRSAVLEWLRSREIPARTHSNGRQRGGAHDERRQTT
jgi:excisionase family DNA binding protein